MSAPRWLSSIPANETAVFETAHPGLRDAIEPLNRIIRIRADAAGGFDDSAARRTTRWRFSTVLPP